MATPNSSITNTKKTKETKKINVTKPVVRGATDYLAKARTLASRLGREVAYPSSPPAPPPPDNVVALFPQKREIPGYITDQTRIPEVVAALESAGTVGVDIETTGLDTWTSRVRLLQVSTGESTYVFDTDKVNLAPVVEALNRVPEILAHNAKFEALFLQDYGLKLDNLRCTQLLYQILTAGERGKSDLKTVAKKILGAELDKSEQTADWSGELTPEMLEYAATDARILPDLYREIMRRIDKARDLKSTVELEMRTLRATIAMTRSGLPANNKKLQQYIEEAKEARDSLVKEMDSFVDTKLPEEFVERNRKNKSILEEREAKVNWQSSEQVAWAFSEAYGITVPTTAKGSPATGKAALEKIDHPLADLVLELNKIKTIPTKWQNAINDRFHGGRLYAEWNQLGAASGRYSCSRPPLQGIPKAGTARTCFEAPKGMRFISSDLSQIEVRVWAAISGDSKLIRDFARGDLDLYRSVAERVFGREVSDGERSAMKAVVLGRNYGMGANTMQARLERALGRPVPRKEVKGYLEELAGAYPEAEKWRKRQETKDPDAVTTTRTMHGRLRRKVSSNPQRFNTPIQGSAADVMKEIACAVVRELVEPNPTVELCALIHDEVVLLAPENEADRVAAELTRIMETVGDATVNGKREPRVPIVADTDILQSLGDKQ